jgi:hypothetical protein
MLTAAVRIWEMMDASLSIEIFCTRPAMTPAAMISSLRVKMGAATARIQRKLPGRLEILRAVFFTSKMIFFRAASSKISAQSTGAACFRACQNVIKSLSGKPPPPGQQTIPHLFFPEGFKDIDKFVSDWTGCFTHLRIQSKRVFKVPAFFVRR